MISRNPKSSPTARQKIEDRHWFRIWLEPRTLFDWLDVRKQAPIFRLNFPRRNPSMSAPGKPRSIQRLGVAAILPRCRKPSTLAPDVKAVA